MKFKSVRTKLLAGFMLVSAVMVVVGVFGLTRQSAISERTEYIYRDVTVPVEYLATTRANLLRSRISLLDSFFISDADAKDEKLAEIEEYWAVVDEAQAKYQATDMTGREEARDRFNAAYPTFQELLREKTIPLSRANDLQAFAKVRDEEIAPVFTELNAALDELFAIEHQAGQDALSSAQDTASAARQLTLVLLVLGVGTSIFLGFMIAKGVSKPLGESVKSLEALAGKDLTHQLEVSTSDETARMAESLNEAVVSLAAALTQITQNSEQLATASEELMAVSTQMGSNAEETSAQSNVVSAAGEQVSRNVAGVATAVEEMTASVREIAKNAADAASVAAQAVEMAAVTNANVSRLGESSIEIGNVVKVITSIAEQTNLLALNATIEAARAGESGKGFAVVANEVKELANETARATEDISRKIEAIQGDTQEAVESIGQITEIINQINDIQNTIASSVEEQAATTNEIGRNVQEAAKGSTEIAENITGVAQAATSTAEGVTSTQQAAEELARMAGELKSLVGEFRF
ncbi:MAG: methyl-accepting chemotaxis protein [Acidimicrobiia bacterium]|nr:methyl-accepting chemotaxis protein [Acidimicrobiia bacterium]